MATSAPTETDLALLLSRAAHGLHHELTAGLASGLLNTTVQVGGAVGLAVRRSSSPPRC